MVSLKTDPQIKVDKLDLIKVTNLCASKDIIKKVERAHRVEKIFADKLCV